MLLEACAVQNEEVRDFHVFPTSSQIRRLQEESCDTSSSTSQREFIHTHIQKEEIKGYIIEASNSALLQITTNNIPP